MNANVYRGRAGKVSICLTPDRDLRYNILFGGLMNVWCQVDCVNTEKTRIVKTLWIKMHMPVLMPIGSTLYMPWPMQWEAICGSLTCRVVGYTLLGDKIECKAEPIGMSFDDDFADMLAIGYQEEEPEELKV